MVKNADIPRPSLRWIFYVAVIAVVIVLGYLRVDQLAEKTREGTTVGHLDKMRQAVNWYYKDHDGVFPRELNVETPFCRYLEKIPPVAKLSPRGHALSPGGAEITYGTDAPRSPGRGWYYNYETGQVFVNSTGLDTRGIPYSTY